MRHGVLSPIGNVAGRFLARFALPCHWTMGVYVFVYLSVRADAPQSGRCTHACYATLLGVPAARGLNMPKPAVDILLTFPPRMLSPTEHALV